MKGRVRLKTEQIILCCARAHSGAGQCIASLKASGQTQARWDYSDMESTLSLPSSWLLWMFRCPSDDNQNYSWPCLLIVSQLCPTGCIITWYFNHIASATQTSSWCIFYSRCTEDSFKNGCMTTVKSPCQIICPWLCAYIGYLKVKTVMSTVTSWAYV